jgi:hypothetical protein
MAGGWEAAVLNHRASARYLNDHPSVWVAMTRDKQTMEDLIAASGAGKSWKKLNERPGFAGWTDDYASILPLLQEVELK